MTARPLNEYGERMARLEQKTESIETAVCGISQKLDVVLETKADKMEVNNIKKLAVSAIGGLLVILLGIVGYLLTNPHTLMCSI